MFKLYASNILQKVKVFVAIADVAGLISKNSALDKHAAHNTTSVYTPLYNFMMLPEKLCTDFTSLNEGMYFSRKPLSYMHVQTNATSSMKCYTFAQNSLSKLAY